MTGRAAAKFTFKGFTWPEGAYALRLIVAAMLAYAASQVLGAEHGYGAVFSAVIVTRPYSQGAVRAGLFRLLATGTGIAMAFAATWLRKTGLNDYELLLAALAPLSLLSAYDQSYRTALISALIMLSASTMGPPDMRIALARALVVGTGAVIGILVSMLVLPQRHDHVVGRKALKVVKGMLSQLHASLHPEPDLRRADAADREVRKLLLEIGQAARDHRPGKRNEHESARIVGLTRRIQSLCILLRSQWRNPMSDDSRAQRLAIISGLQADDAQWAAIRKLPPLEGEAPEAWLLESLARDLIGLKKLASQV